MRIYLCHSSEFDYKKELYEPIRRSDLNNLHNFIFPHEQSKKTLNSKKIFAGCNLIIAEVSFPSTGMGIELGWANMLKKKILVIYRRDCKISRSLKIVSSNFIEYEKNNLIEKITEFIFCLR